MAEFSPGQHVRVPCYGGFIMHHGIVVDGSQVVHFDSGPGKSRPAHIRRTDIGSFAGSWGLKSIQIVPDHCLLPPETVVRRACSRLGHDGYSLLFSNCEHFARWCRGERQSSYQVSRAGRLVCMGLLHLSQHQRQLHDHANQRSFGRAAILGDLVQFAAETASMRLNLPSQTTRLLGIAVGLAVRIMVSRPEVSAAKLLLVALDRLIARPPRKSKGGSTWKP